MYESYFCSTFSPNLVLSVFPSFSHCSGRVVVPYCDSSLYWAWLFLRSHLLYLATPHTCTVTPQLYQFYFSFFCITLLSNFYTPCTFIYSPLQERPIFKLLTTVIPKHEVEGIYFYCRLTDLLPSYLFSLGVFLRGEK